MRARGRADGGRAENRWLAARRGATSLPNNRIALSRAARCVAGEAAEEYCTRVNYCGETDAQKNIKIQKGGVGVAASVSSVGASRAGERITHPPPPRRPTGFFSVVARAAVCVTGDRDRACELVRGGRVGSQWQHTGRPGRYGDGGGGERRQQHSRLRRRVRTPPPPRTGLPGRVY